MACFGLVTPVMAASDMNTPVISSESPSAVTLSKIENMGIGSDTRFSSMATTANRLGRAAIEPWAEVNLPTANDMHPNQVGNAPIGEVTFPIALLALVIYFVYRGVTTSKRKSNL